MARTPTSTAAPPPRSARWCKRRRAHTTVVSSSLSSVFGQPVTFTASVTSGSPGTPTGTVTFKDGATTLGTGALNGSAQATFTTSALSTGAHTITASYGGDASFAPSTSAAISQAVHHAGSTTTPGLLAQPQHVGHDGHLHRDRERPRPRRGHPSGTVTFKDGATVLGTGALSGGHATFSTSALAVGSHSITAVYAADANFNGSTSAALAQKVN